MIKETVLFLLNRIHAVLYSFVPDRLCTILKHMQYTPTPLRAKPRAPRVVNRTTLGGV